MGNGGTQQSYIGAGHYWGSAPGVTHTGGGAVNFPDSWSVRAVLSTAGEIRGYVYPSRDSSSKKYGDVIHGAEKMPNGQWVTLESEVIANTAGASNGVLRTFVNGKLSNEARDILFRQSEKVFPKGMGMLIRNNSSAKNDEVIFIRNWKIYTRP